MEKRTIRVSMGCPPKAYPETWERVPDFFCPGCGTRGLIWKGGEDDYDLGLEYLCAGCGSTFNQPNVRKIDATDNEASERLRALRAPPSEASKETARIEEVVAQSANSRCPTCKTDLSGPVTSAALELAPGSTALVNCWNCGQPIKVTS